MFWHHGLRIEKKKHTYIETSLGFLEESKFITSPCEPGSQSMGKQAAGTGALRKSRLEPRNSCP